MFTEHEPSREPTRLAACDEAPSGSSARGAVLRSSEAKVEGTAARGGTQLGAIALTDDLPAQTAGK